MVRFARLAWLRFPEAAYVSVIRGTPALIQLFFLYFGGPQIGIQLDVFEAGGIGLDVNVRAYMAETMRGAIITVDNGQREVARTLGLSHLKTLCKVMVPQAISVVISPIGNNINGLLKDSARCRSSGWQS